MQVAPLFPDRLGHRRDKGDDVVLDLGFDLLHPRDVHPRALAQVYHSLRWYLSAFGESLTGEQFDLQPLGQLVVL